MADRTEFEAASLTAASVARAHFDAGSAGNFAIVPGGYSVESMEAYQVSPNRTRADQTFSTVRAMGWYLKRFWAPEAFIGANADKATISAIIDYHGSNAPRFCEHRARFVARVGDRLQEWLNISDKPMSQGAFGEFLESHAVDVIKPAAADVMEMVMTFDATKKVVFKQASRLHDGSRQITYTEDNEVRGAVRLPDRFTILAPAYHGMEPEPIDFLVRYRIDDGALRFTVSMHDRKQVMANAFGRCVDALRVDLPENTVIFDLA